MKRAVQGAEPDPTSINARIAGPTGTGSWLQSLWVVAESSSHGGIALLSPRDFDRAYAVLNDILQAVHGQLQFAEAKNGALLAVNLATVVGIGAVTASAPIAAYSLGMWLFVTCVGLSGAGLIALTSFLPIKGDQRHDYARGAGVDGVNLVFWGEINKFTPEAYAAVLVQSLGIAGQPERLHLDLAEQIIINSGIAQRKFARFEVAAWTTVTAATVPALVLAGLWAGAGFEFA